MGKGRGRPLNGSISERPSAWSRFRSFPVWAQVLVWAVAWPVPTALYAACRPPATRRRWWAVTAAAALAWAGVAGASSSESPRAEQAGRTTTDGQTATSAEPPSTPGTDPAAAPPSSDAGPTPATFRPTTTTNPAATTPAPAGDPTAVLAGLRVAPEEARTGYSRELFRHWIDADRNGCDTREEVLRAESHSPAQVDPFGCKVVAGDWYSLYDGLSSDDPAEFDIDHVVALAEAWDSGASGWDAARREAFANDLDRPQALRAVSASSNRSKSDLDPAQWKPTREPAWCEYANDWVAVKKAWGLTADQDEVDDLKVMLRTCTGTSPAPTTAPTTATTTTQPPATGGSVAVTALDCQGEAVTVTNGGSSPADLTGWSIHDEGPNFTYRFPAGSTLAPGAAVTVRSGGAAGPGELHWMNSNVWNNGGDTAHLVNAGGGLVSTRSC